MAPWLTDELPARQMALATQTGRRPRSDRAQRVLDVCLAAAGLVFTAPLIGLAALVMKATSPGPAIYSQTRLGRLGRPFVIYKVRSMTHNCEKQSGVKWSVKGDVRVTWVGRILRKTHIDELPQLINILKGEMSLVGPRPERPEIVLGLEQAIRWYRGRLAVRPGLTGLAQVRLPPDFDLESVRRKLQLDLYYVEKGTVWMDVRLLAGTAFHILGFPVGLSRTLLGLPTWPEVERQWQVPSVEPARDRAVHPVSHRDFPTHEEVSVDVARA